MVKSTQRRSNRQKKYSRIKKKLQKENKRCGMIAHQWATIYQNPINIDGSTW